MNLVIFDLETTGFSPRYHEIIQIAAIRMRHGEIVATDRFETFVRPQNAIPDEITELTGITDSNVADAPEPTEALMALSRFVGDDTLVAHNGRRFDLPFVRECCLRHQLPLREVPFIDSMTFSRRIWVTERSHNLDSVIERLDLSTKGLRRHDARGDVWLLADAVRCMWKRLGAHPDRCPVPLDAGHLPSTDLL
jgi:DNA polymerase III alpha subunit (gram-positive type)